MAVDLNCLESERLSEKVIFSEWEAPTVVVPKKDKLVRICGDFKVTVNLVLDIGQYPLSYQSDLFVTLAGGSNSPH